MRLAVLAVLISVTVLTIPVQAADWRPPAAISNLQKPLLCAAQLPRNFIYDVCEDQVAAFTIALDKARTEGRLLVIEFGATWCPQCSQMHKHLPTDAVLLSEGPELDFSDTFSLIMIGVSTIEKGRQVKVETGDIVLQHILEAAPKAEMRGWPFLAVIDPAQAGKVYTRNTADLFTVDGGAAVLDVAKLRNAIKEAHDKLRLGREPTPEPRRGWLARLYRSVVGER